jgi:hypothetical protein
MERNINIQQELNETSKTIADIALVNTYSIPTNYFEDLSSSILQKIKLAENELSLDAPTLASIQKTNVYTVPANYFDSIKINTFTEAKVIALHTEKKKNFTWLKYAAAACIIGIISTFAFKFFNTSTSKENEIVAGTNLTYKQIKNVDVDVEINKISNAEINNYLCDNQLIVCTEKTDDDVAKELENLHISDVELEKLLGEKTN